MNHLDSELEDDDDELQLEEFRFHELLQRPVIHLLLVIILNLIIIVILIIILIIIIIITSILSVHSLLGAAVADAAARPLHWVYDMELMEELMKVARPGLAHCCAIFLCHLVGQLGQARLFRKLKTCSRTDKTPTSGLRACRPSTRCLLGLGAVTTMLSWLASRSLDPS